MPRRAAATPALPDGAPSLVASRASERSLAAFRGVHNGQTTCLARCLLQREFRLAACVAAGGGGGRRGGRACKAPAHRGGTACILLDDDPGGAARAVIAGQEHAVLEIDHLV